MAEGRPVTNLLAGHFKLFYKQCAQPPEEEEEEMSRVSYNSAMGSLMYSINCARLDLTYAVSTVSWFISNPRK